MGTKSKKNSPNISLMEAIDALTSLAELDIEAEMEAPREKPSETQEHTAKEQLHEWIHRKDADSTVKITREMFKVILSYLQKVYQTGTAHVQDQKKEESVKGIMVLVGKAANKLDKLTYVFEKKHDKSVTQYKEYKQLQEFYKKRLAKKIDTGVLGDWILGITGFPRKESKASVAIKPPLSEERVVVDLDAVKSDKVYELFFMRKDDGSQYFNRKLIKNMKLVCDFGSNSNRGRSEDFLESMRIWSDRCIMMGSKGIVRSLSYRLGRYFNESASFKDREMVESLNKALMALILSSNEKNLYQNLPAKTCGDYFLDFQKYLREALSHREYQKLVAYPKKKHGRLTRILLDMTHYLCLAFFQFREGYQACIPEIKRLLSRYQESSGDGEEAEGPHGSLRNERLYHVLSNDYQTINKVFKRMNFGPLVKIMEELDSEGYLSFDPILQGNHPNFLYHLFCHDNKISCLHLPCPTHQEYISSGTFVEEFIGFLRACKKDKEFFKRHLLFNLQERKGWKGHARSMLLEDLEGHPDFSANLTVITLAKNSDFYHQTKSYSKENHAAIFIEKFKDEVMNPEGDFFIPEDLRKKLSKKVLSGILDGVHRVFFSGKNTLTRQHRLDFIELTYMFLQLWLMDCLKPDSISFTCKDGVDIGAMAGAQVFIFYHLLKKGNMGVHDKELLDMQLYAPAWLIRGRPPHQEVFARFLSCVKCLESTREQYGQAHFPKVIQEIFGKYYNAPIFLGTVSRV